MTSHPPSHPQQPSFWRSRGGVAAIMLMLIGLFYLLREHTEHSLQALPYVILLLCPLMHLFGHKHGGQDDDR